MIVKFLNTNRPGILLFLPLFTAIVWIPFFIKTSTPAFLADSKYVFIDFSQLIVNKYLSISIAFVFTLFNAWLINLIYINSELSIRPIYVYGFCYVLLDAFLRKDPFFHSYQPATLLLIASIWPLLKIDKQRSILTNVFSSGFFIGCASLLYLPAAIFFIVIYFFVQMLRAFNWREWFFPVLGFCLVVLFYFTAVNFLKLDFLRENNLIPFNLISFIEANTLTTSAFIGIVTISVFAFLSNALRAVMHARKQRVIFFYLFSLVIVQIVLTNMLNLTATVPYLSLMGATLFTGNFLTQLSRKWLAEFLFLLIFSSLFISAFF